MRIVKVDSGNLHVYLNLCQSYEGEFSAITQKRPDENGLFELDTHIGGDVLGYLLYAEDSPVGFAAVRIKPGGESFEVCEFYIAPCCRKNGLGKGFATEIFKMHRGNWEIKQLYAAGYATEFWRKTIRGFTKGQFQEDLYQDGYWGRVVRQQFTSADPDAASD